MTEAREARQHHRRRGAAIGLLAAGALAGGITAGMLSANAATGSTSGGDPSPSHGTAAHEALEKPVTGTDATKAKAAAVKLVGSGTAGAVTTDMSGSGYEVTVTKSDGSQVEVHLDQSFGLDDHGRLGG